MIIVNTEPAAKMGRHWLLFYFAAGGLVEMFDSLGKDLNHYPPEISLLAARQGTMSRVLKDRVQLPNSSLCGHYCLYYAYRRCLGEDMASIAQGMPSADWIRSCIPLLFSIPQIESEYQTCAKC